MRRRDVIAGALAMSTGGLARPSRSAAADDKPRRLGLLSPGTAQSVAPILRFALPELASRGFAVTRSLVLEGRHAEDVTERMQELARELAETSPDVILAASSEAIRAAMEAAPQTPVVMALTRDDPVAEGLVASLSRPGGRVTGLVLPPDSDARRVALATEALPAITRFAIVSSKQRDDRSEATYRAATALGFDVVAYRGDSSKDYDLIFNYMSAGPSTALVLNAGPALLPDASELAQRAVARRCPAIGAWHEAAQAGCVLAYGPSFQAASRRIGQVLASVLEGADPAEIPVEQLEPQVVVNAKAARMLDVTIPPAVLARAHQVVE